MGYEKHRRPILATNFEDYVLPDSLATGGGATVPSDFVFVEQASDFGTPVGGVYSLGANKTYWVVTTVDLLGDRLVGAANTVIRGSSSENCRIKSTGLVGTALITSQYSLPMLNITIEADTALDLQAIDANQALDWNGVNFTSCANVGLIKDYSNCIWVNCALLSSANLTFDGSIGTVGFDGCIFSGIAGQSTIILAPTYVATRRFRAIYSAVVAFGGATGFEVQAGATLPVEGLIFDTVNFAGGATYISGADAGDNETLWVNNKGIVNSASIAIMTMQSNATETVITSSGVEVKASGTTVLDTANTQKFTMPVSNRLTYGGAIEREFRVTAILSVTSGNNVQVGTYIAKNGTPIQTSETYTTTDGGGRRENVAVQTIINLTENDYIEIFVENETNTQNITVTDLNVVTEALN